MLGAAQGVLAGQLGFLRQAYAQSVAALNPVAYWLLGEAGGTVMVDQRAVQHGTYNGSIEYDVEPLLEHSFGTSVAFNGSNVYGEVPHNAAFVVPNGTIAFAVQADSVSGQHVLVAKDSVGVAGGFTVDVNNGRPRATSGTRAAARSGCPIRAARQTSASVKPIMWR